MISAEDFFDRLLEIVDSMESIYGADLNNIWFELEDDDNPERRDSQKDFWEG